MISVVNLKQAICISRRLTIKSVAIIHDPNLRGGTGTKQGRKVFRMLFCAAIPQYLVKTRPIATV
jgi:hypothetical protein